MWVHEWVIILGPRKAGSIVANVTSDPWTRPNPTSHRGGNRKSHQGSSGPGRFADCHLTPLRNRAQLPPAMPTLPCAACPVPALPQPGGPGCWRTGRARCAAERRVPPGPWRFSEQENQQANPPDVASQTFPSSNVTYFLTELDQIASYIKKPILGCSEIHDTSSPSLPLPPVPL